jgi:DNA-binding response OmpR family regulator
MAPSRKPEGAAMRNFGIRNENGQTILLVEGDDCLRTLMREHLEANGFEVKDAAEASEAMRLAGVWGSKRPDLLLTSAELPNASASWMARELKKRSNPRMAVVYLVENELDMATLDGADFHVQKPFSFIQLLSAVEEALIEAERKGAGARPALWVKGIF